MPCTWSAAHRRRARCSPSTLRFLNAAPQPQREKRGEDSHKEHRAPSPARQHKTHHQCGRSKPDGPGTLHEAQRAPAMSADQVRTPALRHWPIRRPCQVQERAKHRELPEVLRESTGGRKHGIDQHARHHRAGATKSIGHMAEHQPTHRPAKQRNRAERAGLSFGQPRSAITAASVSENNITSNASSAQPSDAATRARFAGGRPRATIQRGRNRQGVWSRARSKGWKPEVACKVARVNPSGVESSWPPAHVARLHVALHMRACALPVLDRVLGASLVSGVVG